MSIIPNQAELSVSSVLSVRDPSPSTRADIDLGWSDLLEPSNHLGCPSVVPEGETAERVVRGVGLPAWDRGGRGGSTSISPIEAHVQCSAVSVGYAAGRLAGTRGTPKARFEHSMVESGRTPTIHVGHSIVELERT